MKDGLYWLSKGHIGEVENNATSNLADRERKKQVKAKTELRSI